MEKQRNAILVKVNLMKKTMSSLYVNLYVECPYCESVIDLFEEDSDYIYSMAIFNNKWEDIENQEEYCPNCKKEFLVEGIEY